MNLTFPERGGFSSYLRIGSVLIFTSVTPYRISQLE